MTAFTKRCFKEILRDPINIIFGLGFPVILLLLMNTIQANVPVELFGLERLTPGIIVFGLSFLSLFSSTLIAKDRESALIQRLYTTPLKSTDFILGYMLPLIPIAISQTVVCFATAIILGLEFSVNIIYTVIFTLPVALFNISLGLLCGSIFGVKQVGGICGALLTNLTGWLSGVWFDIELLGEGFRKIANILPFIHAVELERNILCGDFTDAVSHLYVVLLYAAITSVCAVMMFLQQMKNQ